MIKIKKRRKKRKKYSTESFLSLAKESRHFGRVSRESLVGIELGAQLSGALIE